MCIQQEELGPGGSTGQLTREIKSMEGPGAGCSLFCSVAYINAPQLFYALRINWGAY